MTNTAEPTTSTHEREQKPQLGFFALFIVIALSLVGAAHHYFWRRLVVQPQWPTPIGAILSSLLLAGAVLLVVSPIAERTLRPRTLRFIAWPSTLWMGAAFYLLLGLGFSDALLALLRMSGTSVARARAAGVSLATLGVLAMGLRSVLLGPRLTPVEVWLKRWPKALDGYRIVQISDIHIGPLLHRGFAQHIVSMVQSAAPDLIVVTGDLVDGSVQQLDAEVAPFADLRARHGVYFVTGNHDYYSGAGRWVRKVTELGMRALRNTHVTIADAVSGSAFVLAGVDDRSGKRMGGTGDDVKAAMLGVGAEQPVILLAHDPQTFEKAKSAGIDLQLSGHTHGGQMWPFAYLVRLATRFVAGLYRVADAQLYVSRGTGFWGPPLRVLAPAEVTVLTLRAEQP